MDESIIKFLETWSPLDVVLIAQNFDRFLWGALTTLELTLLSLLIGGILSIPLAIARAGKNPLLSAPVWVFTYIFRGTPLLVQTYLIYYGLGQFDWIRDSFLWEPVLSKAWYCALIAFSLNTAAYTTELLRGSIVNTRPRGNRGCCGLWSECFETHAGALSCPAPFGGHCRHTRMKSYSCCMVRLLPAPLPSRTCSGLGVG